MEERRSLEKLGRNELIERARSLGVAHPHVLTRDELIDELVRRSVPSGSKQSKARGFFGRARDLVASILENGLHLPEAAERVRNPAPTETESDDSGPPPLATVTLAEIYAAQGHTDRALQVVREVLAHEPEHETAKALLTRLTDGERERAVDDAPAARGSGTAPVAAGSAPAPRASSPKPVDATELRSGNPDARVPATPEATTETETPETAGSGAQHEGPIPMLDDGPLPERYNVDEAVVMPVDPTTAYVYWEVRAETVARLRATDRPGGICIRLYSTLDSWAGSRTEIRDIETDASFGDYFVYGLPEGARLRSALGWRYAGGAFEPLMVSPIYTAPPAAPSAFPADTIAHWSRSGSTVVYSHRQGDAATPAREAHAPTAAAAPWLPEPARAAQASTTSTAVDPALLAPLGVAPGRSVRLRWVPSAAPVGSSELAGHWHADEDLGPLASVPPGVEWFGASEHAIGSSHFAVGSSEQALGSSDARADGGSSTEAGARVPGASRERLGQ